MTPCPSHEELAALVEGRVSRRERGRLQPHLAACDDCYETFSAAARHREQYPAESAVPIPGPRRGGAWAVAWPLAAAAGLGALALWRGTPGVGPDARGPQDTPPSPSAALTSGTTPRWILEAPWQWGAARRRGFTPERGAQRQFILGLHLGALERVCRLEGRSRSRSAEELDRSLTSWNLVPPVERARLLGECPRAEEPLDTPEARWRALGRALEAWRIAVVERDPSAFDPQRRVEVVRLVEELQPQGPGPDRARRIAVVVPGQEARDWEDLEADLLDLVALLCA